MADTWEGSVAGESCLTQSSHATHTNNFTAGNDTDSDEPLLDISEAGFDNTNIVTNRANETGFQMEHDDCVKRRETIEKDLASSPENVGLLEPQHHHLQQQHNRHSLQSSSSTNEPVSPFTHRTRQNPFDFPADDFWQKSNSTRTTPDNVELFDPLNFGDPTFVSSYISPPTLTTPPSQNPAFYKYSRNPLTSPSSNSHHPATSRGHFSPHISFQPASLHSSIPSVAATTAATHFYTINQSPVYAVNPVLGRYDRNAVTDSQFIISPQPSQTIQPGQAQHYPNKSVLFPSGRVGPTNINLGNKIGKDDGNYKVPNLDLIIKDYTSTADSSRENFEDLNTGSRVATRTLSQNTPGSGSQRGRPGRREFFIDKKNLLSSKEKSVTGGYLDDKSVIRRYLEDKGGYLEDKGVTRDYLRDKDITHGYSEAKDVTHGCLRDRDITDAYLGDTGVTHGYSGDKDITYACLANKGVGRNYLEDTVITQKYPEHSRANIRLSINSGIMGEQEQSLVDGYKGGRHRLLGSNSDKHLVDEGSTLNSVQPEIIDTLYKEKRENVLYAEKMYDSRSHWEDVDEGRLLEEAPLLDAEFLSARHTGRSSNLTACGARVSRDTSQNIYGVFNKAGVGSRITNPVTDCQTSSARSLSLKDNLTNSCHDSDVLKKGLHESCGNNTRGGIDGSRAMKNYIASGDSRHIHRNSYGEFSPLAHVMDNGRPSHGENGEIRGTCYAHCHKKRMTSLTDKLALRQLISVVVLCLLFMIGEGVGGVLANSIALFTDVLHLGSDLISFIISLVAMWLANKPATHRMSFGYHRAEVLGALFSVFIIWLVSGVLCYIAVDRILHEHYKDVKPDEMLITASLGVLFNIIMGLVLHSEMCCGHAHSHSKFGHGHSHGVKGHGHSHSHSKDDLLDVASGSRRESNSSIQREGFNYQRLDDSGGSSTPDQQLIDTASMVMAPVTEELNSDEDHACSDEESLHKHKNINVRAAFIHVVGDIIQSLGVLVAALIIKFTTDERFRLADPICTFLFSLLVLITTITVLRDALLVVMEGVPRDLSIDSLRKELIALDGVVAVHSLHMWALTLDRNALSVHLAVENPLIHDQVLSDATRLIQNRHHFFHSTIQVELYDEIAMKSCKECLELS